MPKPKSDSYYNKVAKTLVIGEKVKVYTLIGCENFIGIKTISHIGPMNSSPRAIEMIWFKEGGGAWHPGAVSKLD